MQSGHVFPVGFDQTTANNMQALLHASSGPDYALLAEILTEDNLHSSQQAPSLGIGADARFSSSFRWQELKLQPAGRHTGQQLVNQQHQQMAVNHTHQHRCDAAPVAGSRAAVLDSAAQNQPMLRRLLQLHHTEHLQVQEAQQQQAAQAQQSLRQQHMQQEQLLQAQMLQQLLQQVVGEQPRNAADYKQRLCEQALGEMQQHQTVPSEQQLQQWTQQLQQHPGNHLQEGACNGASYHSLRNHSSTAALSPAGIHFTDIASDAAGHASRFCISAAAPNAGFPSVSLLQPQPHLLGQRPGSSSKQPVHASLQQAVEEQLAHMQQQRPARSAAPQALADPAAESGAGLQPKPEPQTGQSSHVTPAASVSPFNTRTGDKAPKCHKAEKQQRVKAPVGSQAAANTAAAKAAAAVLEMDAAIAEEPGMSRFRRNRLRHKANKLHMEAELVRKLQEVQLLADENEQLKLEQQALSMVLAVRDRHLRLLQQYGPPEYPRSVAAAAAQSFGTSSSSTTGSAGDQSTSSAATGDNCCAAPQAAAARAVAEATGVANCCVICTGRLGGMQHDSAASPARGTTQAAGKRSSEHSINPSINPGTASLAVSIDPSSFNRGDVNSTAAESGAAMDWLPLLSNRLQQLAAHCRPLPPVTVAACKAMTASQLARYWKHHVYNVAALLQQFKTAATAAAAADARQRLCDMIEHQGFNSMSVATINTASILRFCAVDMESGCEINPHSAELDEHWTACVAGLQLSEQQQQLFMAIFERIARDMLAISRQRKLLFAEIFMATAAAAQAKAQKSTTAAAADSSSQAPELPALLRHLFAAAGNKEGLKLQDLSIAMESLDSDLLPCMQDMLAEIHMTVHREVLAAITLNATFVDYILDPIQVARLQVLSYPIFPNALGMAMAIAKHTGWKPKAGAMTCANPSNSQGEQQQQQQQGCGTSAAVATATTESGSKRTTRATARKQQSLPAAPLEATPAAAAAEVVDAHTGMQHATLNPTKQPAMYSLRSSDTKSDNAAIDMPAAVSEILYDVQSGRIAAAQLILQAAEQGLQLPCG